MSERLNQSEKGSTTDEEFLAFEAVLKNEALTV
jgi:hypothetical protein